MITIDGSTWSIADITLASDVSASNQRSGRTDANRSARRRTCWALSSAVTYSARPGHHASSCSSRVLLPMPGSPPSNVTEPGTIPPPSTLSSSPMPVGCGLLVCGSTSPISCGFDPAGAMDGTSPVAASSSTSVFHCEHNTHCPTHLGCVVPHSLQTYSTRWVLVRAIPVSMARGYDTHECWLPRNHLGHSVGEWGRAGGGDRGGAGGCPRAGVGGVWVRPAGDAGDDAGDPRRAGGGDRQLAQSVHHE